MPELSRRPYLLRAMHEWMLDCGHTPHIIIDATQQGVQVPQAYVTGGRIVLNLSPSATQALQLGNEFVEFNARFGGVSHYIRVPVEAVAGIYARESGEGIVFGEEFEARGEADESVVAEPELPVVRTDPPDAPPPPRRPAGGRPTLKVVK
ncbi:MAG: hypothetical protein RL026_488 [Pseudomonadota bacterium]